MPVHVSPPKYPGKSRPGKLRDGDKARAHRRIWYLISVGRLPSPRAFACMDCGAPARDYDHYLGYAVIHHLDVEPVCHSCNIKRGFARGEFRSRKGQGQKTFACRVCGREEGPFRHGRCNRCRQYFDVHGADRLGPP